MHPVLLILVPLVTGLLSFLIKNEKSAKIWALVSSTLTVIVSVMTLLHGNYQNSYDAPWLPMLGSRFSVSLDGVGKVLTLLTAVSFPIIFA